MVSLVTILLFFVYTWSFGFTATYYVKKAETFLERNLMNVGIGLGVFAILSIILNFFRLPLDWKLFLVLSLIVPGYALFKKIKTVRTGKISWLEIKQKLSISARSSLNLTKSDLAVLIILLIFLLSLYIYTRGAFAYPYLEDEDPWGHAVGIKYVALEKTAYDPPLTGGTFNQVLSYIDPYPPAYDIWLGVLHQTSPNLLWTMKFFNALLISLGLVFFYFFAKAFLQNRNKALWATVILASVPCYLSHFIWAHTLAITLFFPTLYALVMLKEDKKWTLVAALMIGSIWVSQNLEQPIKLTTMLLIYILVGSIACKKFFKHESFALIGGIALAFFWWGAMIKKYSFKGFISVWHPDLVARGGEAGGALNQVSSGILAKLFSLAGAATDPGGTASRAYTSSDFFIAQGQNQINAPIGVGIVVSLLALLGIVYVLRKYRAAIVRKEHSCLCITLFWLIFTFWAVNGETFPVSVARGAFRTWMLLAIPVAIMATEGVYFLKSLLKSFTKSKGIEFFLLFLIILGIFFTSIQQKFELNTAAWPTSGSFGHPAEPYEYAAWFSSIPLNTKVFLYSPRDKLTIGFGAFSCDWCQEVLDFREKILNKNAQELHAFLKEENYEYFLINGRMDSKYFNKDYGNETEPLLSQRYNEIINSGLFAPVYQKENIFVVFKVN